MEWTEIFIPMTVFPATAYIVYIAVNNSRELKMARMQADMHRKLLDKFGSSPFGAQRRPRPDSYRRT